MEKVKSIIIKIAFPFVWLFKRTEEHHDFIEIVLTGIALSVAYVLYKETKEQVKIAKDALEHQRIADSSNGIYQWRRDSTANVKTDSSLELTRRSNERGEEGLRAVENNMSLTTEISRTSIQPFLFVDTVGEIQNFKTGLVPYNEYSISNAGATPAYRIVIVSNITFEYAFTFNQETINAYKPDQNEIGWFLAPNRYFSHLIAYWYANKMDFGREDSIRYWVFKEPILLVVKIFYEDAMRRPRYTQQGYTRTADKPGWMALAKYMRSDHDKQTQTNK